MMAKICVFLADGFEEIEALTPVDILRRGGMDVVTVSIGKKTVAGSHGINVEADVLLDEADTDDADMLVLPGGKLGTENLKACRALEEKILEFNEKKKFIAAICAAPTILGGLGILKGKKAVCYGGLEEKLTGALVSDEPVVRDGHLITSRGMGTSVDFGLKLLEIFTDSETSAKMAKSIMCP